jgi:2-iminoacetate synthase ThiH
MMEENVVSASGTDKTNANEIELQRIISRAGFIPQKRDSEYVSLSTEINLENNISALIPMQN